MLDLVFDIEEEISNIANSFSNRNKYNVFIFI